MQTVSQFGECVLSLLIVETTESREYYVIAGLGVLTVIVLQALKFESEPSHSDGHALWRNMHAGMCFSLLIQVLSMGLIAFGVSYKVMLTTIHKDHESAGENGDRILTMVPSVTENATVALFCGSLTIVFISMELMLGTHRGARENYKLLFLNLESGNLKLNWPLLIISAAKFCLIIFTASLSQWKTDPTSLTVTAFLVVTALMITRIVGWGVVHKKKEIKRVLCHIANDTQDVDSSIAKVSKSTQEGIKRKLVSSVASASNSLKSRNEKTDAGCSASSDDIEFDSFGTHPLMLS